MMAMKILHGLRAGVDGRPAGRLKSTPACAATTRTLDRHPKPGETTC